MTTSKIVTDNDTKNEEMRFLRYVSVIKSAFHTIHSAPTVWHGLFNIHVLNSSAPFTAPTAFADPRWDISFDERHIILLSAPPNVAF